ncbi:MAG: P-loop NTPase fold protein [Gammaproteobacteria bacterium]|nr:P-loop NTPase fold protein [Gammaproteobacteria bacterium]
MGKAIRIQPREIDVPQDDPFQNDLLGRKESAEVLTRLIDVFEGPCVLAVDAAWGNGKTTFLNMWAQHLLNRKFPLVKFNAWETDFSNEPLVTLSAELMKGLQEYTTSPPGEKTDLTQKINETKKVATEIVRWVTPGLIRAAMGLLDVAPLLKEEVAQILTSYAEDRLSVYEKAQESVKEFRVVLEDMAKVLSEEREHPLVIMIDELDRCRPSYAVELLEVAKHLFSVDHVVFVLAINRDQLGHSIKGLYGSGFDAEDYLRRFFDIDFQLPEPERDTFIDVSLRAACVPDYFQRTQRSEMWNYEDALTFFQVFFKSSDLSLRRIAQAIHRLGLVLASLRGKHRLAAMAAVVALILRTINADLYHRFIRGEASDEQVVDAVFSRSGANDIREEKKSNLFEAVVVLACYEVSGSRDDEIETPLMKKYRIWAQSAEKGATPDFPDAPRAEDVIYYVDGLLERTTTPYRTGIGFVHSVQCLELLYSGLEDDSLEDKT